MKTITIKNEKHWHEVRSGHIGASEIAALFGTSPYMTEYQLFQIKTGAMKADDLSQVDIVNIGTDFEAGIATFLARKYSIEMRKGAYVEHETLKGLGTSLDYEVKENGHWVPLEIKNIRFLTWRDSWTHEGEPMDEGAHYPPLHIDLQLQSQMACTGANYGYIGAMVGGETAFLIKRERREQLCDEIVRRTKLFWQNIENNTPPKAGTKDLNAVLKTQKATKKAINLQGDNVYEGLLHDYLECGEKAKVAKKKQDEIKLQIMDGVGEYEEITLNGGKIKISTIKAKEERTAIYKAQPEKRSIRITGA